MIKMAPYFSPDYPLPVLATLEFSRLLNYSTSHNDMSPIFERLWASFQYLRYI